MRDRSLDIFEATVREFILTGEPVSSSRLYEHYDFGIKPASIRIELTNLTDSGYLEQPHHASGRVPSDRGFAFYADRAIAEAHPSRDTRSLNQAMLGSAWDTLADVLADELGTVGIVADLEEGSAFTRGIPSLVEHLDWESRDELTGILRDIEQVADRIGRFRTKLQPSRPQAFVGEGSPFGASPAIASVAARYVIRGRPVAIIAIGPRRMDYDRAAQLFATVAHLTHTAD